MREKPKSKLTTTSMLLATTLLVGITTTAHSAITEAQLQSAMQRFCIPPTNYSCDPTGLAHPIGTNCLPDTEGYFWDVSTRTAREIKCPAGYVRVFVENGDCPSGTINNYVGNQCPATNLYELY